MHSVAVVGRQVPPPAQVGAFWAAQAVYALFQVGSGAAVALTAMAAQLLDAETVTSAPGAMQLSSQPPRMVHCPFARSLVPQLAAPTQTSPVARSVAVQCTGVGSQAQSQVGGAPTGVSPR